MEITVDDHYDPYANLASRITEFKIKHKLTQLQVAQKINATIDIGWDQPIISKMENGKRDITLLELIAVMACLELSFEELTQ